MIIKHPFRQPFNLRMYIFGYCIMDFQGGMNITTLVWELYMQLFCCVVNPYKKEVLKIQQREVDVSSLMCDFEGICTGSHGYVWGWVLTVKKVVRYYIDMHVVFCYLRIRLPVVAMDDWGCVDAETKVILENWIQFNLARLLNCRGFSQLVLLRQADPFGLFVCMKIHP